MTFPHWWSITNCNLPVWWASWWSRSSLSTTQQQGFITLVIATIPSTIYHHDCPIISLITTRITLPSLNDHTHKLTIINPSITIRNKNHPRAFKPWFYASLLLLNKSHTYPWILSIALAPHRCWPCSPHRPEEPEPRNPWLRTHRTVRKWSNGLVMAMWNNYDGYVTTWLRDYVV